MAFNTTTAVEAITTEERIQQVIDAITDAGHLDRLTTRSVGFKYLLGGLGITGRASNADRAFINAILDTLGIE